MLRTVLSLFLLGVSFGAGPCLASCGPLFLSYSAGSGKNISKSIASYFIFSLARIAVYVLLGVLVYLLGKFLTQRIFTGLSKYIFIFGGIFVVCIGILIGMGRHPDAGICRFFHKNLLEHDKKSVLILGLITGLLPCAPLFALFSYVGLISKSVFLSALYAFFFGLGTFLSPLALLAIFAGSLPAILQRFKPIFSRVLNFVCAAILIILGAQLIGKAL